MHCVYSSVENTVSASFLNTQSIRKTYFTWTVSIRVSSPRWGPVECIYPQVGGRWVRAGDTGYLHYAHSIIHWQQPLEHNIRHLWTPKYKTLEGLTWQEHVTSTYMEHKSHAPHTLTYTDTHLAAFGSRLSHKGIHTTNISDRATPEVCPPLLRQRVCNTWARLVTLGMLSPKQRNNVLNSSSLRRVHPSTIYQSSISMGASNVMWGGDNVSWCEMWRIC